MGAKDATLSLTACSSGAKAHSFLDCIPYFHFVFLLWCAESYKFESVMSKNKHVPPCEKFLGELKSGLVRVGVRSCRQ